MRKNLTIVCALVLFAVAGGASAGGFGKVGAAPASNTPTVEEFYLPSDPWQEAMRAGGVVHLGIGEFFATEVLELQNSLRVSGMGPEETVLRFVSDGGAYGEQMAIFEAESGGGEFFFSDLIIMQANGAAVVCTHIKK